MNKTLFTIILGISALFIIYSCSSAATGGSEDNGGGKDVSISGDGAMSPDVESSTCKHGDMRECYSGPAKTKNIGICKAGKQYCIEGEWSGCEQEVLPKSSEICGNNADDNCDGQVDEGCPCTIGSVRECYGGPAETRNVGSCKSGYQECVDDGKGEGVWGECKGQVLPAKDSCDGIQIGGLPTDGDCDGMVDSSVVNACGWCGPEPREVCLNGIDDNCNNQVDEGCDCNADCECSGGDCECKPRTNQPCYDGPLGTMGVGECRQGVHDCVQAGNGWQWTECKGQVLPSEEICGDGKDNDCDGLADNNDSDCGQGGGDCKDGDTRACYDGPSGAGGVGICKKGIEVCNGGKWSGVCVGAVKPEATEVCGNGLDDNCNGEVDEGCGCNGKSEQECFRGPKDAVFNEKSICKKGKQVCINNEYWGECEGDVLGSVEICSNGLDDDCDGVVENGCSCQDGEQKSCYSGDPLTRHKGVCQDGISICSQGEWGGCEGEVLPQQEVCGDGIDNDCNGLTDENINACGKCDDSCYTKDYNKPGDCKYPDRTCDSVEPDPNNPNAITLSETTLPKTPFIYISVTAKNQVAKLDTSNGVKLWQKSSHGTWPSRTAVAFDYSVWVGNRGFYNPSSPDASNLVHLDLDGNLICRVDAVGTSGAGVRGVAIDAEGYVWAGVWDTGKLYKVHPTNVDNSQNPPRCEVVGVYDTDVNIYGLAIDGNGYLWTASPYKKAKVDTKTGQVVQSVNDGVYYGVAVDKNDNVWYGGLGGNGPIHKVDGKTYQVVNSQSGTGYTAVTVHPDDNSVWGSGYGNNTIIKIDNATGNVLCKASIPQISGCNNCSNPHGIAVAADGRVWMPLRYGGYALVYDKNCNFIAYYEVDKGQELYTYSDMTGMQLGSITAKGGHWIQNFDTGYSNPQYYSVEWMSIEPPGTGVEVQVRAAKTAGELQTNPTQWCGPFTQSPANLTNCGFLNGNRWLQVDFRLWTTQNGVKPSVSDVKVNWARP